MSASPRLQLHNDQTGDDATVLSPSEEAAYGAFIDDRSSFLDGVLHVGNKRFFPSEVLRQLDPNAYDAGIADFRKARSEEITDIVISSFPTPIAYWFHMFSRAYDNETQRWLFLKDTWEATIRMIHAMVVADALRAQVSLKASKKDEFSAKSILSDSMDRLIANIEEIVRQCSNMREKRLETLQLLGRGTPNQLRTLNRLRNSFSHDQTPNEKQAAAKIDEALKELLPVFDDLRELSEVKLIRFRRNHDNDPYVIHFEPFQGANTTPDRMDWRFTDEELQGIRSMGSTYLSSENALLIWNHRLLCLSPLFRVREVESRHGSQLCMFKRTRMSGKQTQQLEYEVLGESDKDLVDRSTFENHISSIEELFSDAVDARGK